MKAYQREKERLSTIVQRIDEAAVLTRLNAGGSKAFLSSSDAESLAVHRLVCDADVPGWRVWAARAAIGMMTYYNERSYEDNRGAEWHLGCYSTVLALCSQQQVAIKAMVKSARPWLAKCTTPHLNWVANTSVLLTAALASRSEYDRLRAKYWALLEGDPVGWPVVIASCDAILARDQTALDAHMPGVLTLYRYLVRHRDGVCSGAAQRTICLWGIAINEAARIAGLQGADLGPELPLLPAP
jgi:hypothetical protein